MARLSKLRLKSKRRKCAHTSKVVTFQTWIKDRLDFFSPSGPSVQDHAKTAFSLDNFGCVMLNLFVSIVLFYLMPTIYHSRSESFVIVQTVPSSVIVLYFHAPRELTDNEGRDRNGAA